MSIHVVNGPEFKADMLRKAMALDKLMDAATNKTATTMYATIRRTTPVQTGNLRKGWQKNKEGKWHYVIKNDVEYAPYVEFGTSRMRGRHMLANAIHLYRPIHIKMCTAAVKKAMEA